LCLFNNSPELNSLSNLRVSELQERLRYRISNSSFLLTVERNHNASTKGSKAELIQRLVRYICIFSNPEPPPPLVIQEPQLVEQQNILSSSEDLVIPNTPYYATQMRSPSLQSPDQNQHRWIFHVLIDHFRMLLH